MLETVTRHNSDGDYAVITPSTAAAFAARARQDEPPDACPVLGRCEVRLAFYGEGESAQAGSAVVIGWSRDRGRWTPIVLCAASLKLGGTQGSEQDTPNATQRWVDEISSVSGLGRASGPVPGVPAMLFVETAGVELIEVQCVKGAAVSMGALLARC